VAIGHVAGAQPAAAADRPRLRIFLPLALPLVVLAGFAVYAVLTPFRAEPGPPPGKQGALVWGDGIFADTAELKAWLRLHGASYRAWLHAHPAAARMVAGRARAPHRAVPRRFRRSRPTQAKPAPAVLPTSGGGIGVPEALTVAVGVLIAALLAVAATPRRLLARSGRSAWSPETRVLLVGIALALLAGTAIALLIG
jgi:hypothetical protein